MDSVTQILEKEMDLVSEINDALKRAEQMGFYEADKNVRALESMKEQYQKRGNLTKAQENYLHSLLRRFSEVECVKFMQWKHDWENDEHVRERGDVISKYYLANSSWFISVARVVQDNLKGLTEEVPNFHQFHRMTLNEYAEKVWKSHTAPLRWNLGELVQVRSAAKVEGYTYNLRAEGVNLRTDPCMVIEVDPVPISNSATWDEKKGGCRWVTINPVGSTHLFNVMEKDLKVYRKPKRRK